MQHAHVHTVVDDRSRVAYAEVHDDETGPTPAVLRRAVLWSTARGVTVQRVLTDDGRRYESQASSQECNDLDLDLDVTHERTRPHRPQTDGEIERFYRTMTAE